MPAKPRLHSPEDDLAFLRSVVQGSGSTRLAGSSALLAGGLLYGVQSLFHLGQFYGVIHWPGWATLIFLTAITAAFLAVLVWAINRDRMAGFTGTTANRAVNAVFGGAGLANMAMIIVFGAGVARTGELSIWLYYPAVIFAFQGAAWYVAWMLGRQTWRAFASAGWFAASIALGLLNEQPGPYLMVCAAALFLLLALPGWLMMREAAQARAKG